MYASPLFSLGWEKEKVNCFSPLTAVAVPALEEDRRSGKAIFFPEKPYVPET